MRPNGFRLRVGADWVDVAIATLDDPVAFPPEKAIWTEDKLPWAILNPKLPAFPRSSGDGASC